MTVNAPFRFARINRWIHSPAWAPLVSHDVPFADGLSGTATVTVTAKTPLLVGGRRRKGRKQENGRPAEAGEVWPVRLPDGRYALPGSTMQGLCRQILEIAAFGRLGGRIDKRRFGIRDLGTSATAKLHYISRLSDTSEKAVDEINEPVYAAKSRPGWLVEEKGRHWIIPCLMTRIEVSDIEKYRQHIAKDCPADGLTKVERKAKKRYEFFLKSKNGFDDLQVSITGCEKDEKSTEEYGLSYMETTDHPRWQEGQRSWLRESRGVFAPSDVSNEEKKLATLVLTGMPNLVKHRDFAFHTFSRSEVQAQLKKQPNVKTAFPNAIEIDDEVWRTFVEVNVNVDGSKEAVPAWEFWQELTSGSKRAPAYPIPVFWWADEKNPAQVATFGMAMGFKAAWPLSTHDLLGHSHPDHLTEPKDAAPDLPDLIFGMAAEAEGGRGLKRRAWFGMGLCAQTDPQLRRTSTGVLAAPKPKYLGLYVRQRPATNNHIQQRGNPAHDYKEPFAAYRAPDLSKVQLRPDKLLSDEQAKARALDNLKRPELAGVKIWPAIGKTFPQNDPIKLPPSPRIQGQPDNIGEQVKVRLNLLPADTVFTVPLTFHNLRPAELGALLWALSFGDPRAFGGQGQGARLRHRLGMGKPFNFGEVEISVSGLALDDPPADWADKAATDFVKAFEDHMTAAYTAAPDAPAGAAWATSPQVLALRKAADPEANADVMRGNPGQPAYMNVTGNGSYKQNADQGYFLGPYVAENHELQKPPPGGPGPQNRNDRPGPPPLDPVVGATIELKPGAKPDITPGPDGLRRGVIVKAGKDAYADFEVRMTGSGKVVKLKASLFTVIAPPAPQP